MVAMKTLDNQWVLVHHGIKGQKWGVRNGPPYPIKRSVSELPTYRLPASEYKHVMSEVSTHISDTQKEMDAFSKPIGPYTYYFENMHDGTYRVVDKRKTADRMEDYWDDG